MRGYLKKYMMIFRCEECIFNLEQQPIQLPTEAKFVEMNVIEMVRSQIRKAFSAPAQHDTQSSKQSIYSTLQQWLVLLVWKYSTKKDID